MKNLVIHPNDPTTRFLSPIYAPLKNKTVITDGVSKNELKRLIEDHDRVIMLGHGSPYGLMSVGQFPGAGFHIIDNSMSELLKKKSDNIYIWCHADQFVRRHRLSGLCCAMFLSKIGEAFIYGFDDIDWDFIDESNNRFASIMGKYIDEPLPFFYRKLIFEYGLLAQTNSIARFNMERLYLNPRGKNNSNQFVNIVDRWGV